MISEGDVVTIVASDELGDMRLNDLIGQRGRVTSLLLARRNPGCMVHFKERYLGERNWFIPITSIETKRQADRRRSEELAANLKL